jgi:hypothetical protein
MDSVRVTHGEGHERPLAIGHMGSWHANGEGHTRPLAIGQTHAQYMQNCSGPAAVCAVQWVHVRILVRCWNGGIGMCVCVCVYAYVRVCVCMCLCVCARACVLTPRGSRLEANATPLPLNRNGINPADVTQHMRIRLGPHTCVGLARDGAHVSRTTGPHSAAPWNMRG